MAEQIRDGEGEGYLAGVTNENRLKVNAITQSLAHHANQEEGDAYHLLFSATPSGANVCFLYMKNTADEDLVVEGIWFRVASAEQIQVKLRDTGTPTGGATATPVNCNAGSGHTATVTCETANSITGLSGGSVVEKYWLTSTESNHYNFEHDIIIPTNAAFTLYAVTGNVAVSGTVVFNIHD